MILLITFLSFKWIILGAIIMGYIMWARKIEKKSSGWFSQVDQFKPFVIFLLTIIGWLIIF